MMKTTGSAFPDDPDLRQRIHATRLVVFDFDGVFTDNTVYVFENGLEAVRCFRGDGLGLHKLAQLGLSTVIISTETNPVVTVRSRKLGLRCLQGCDDKWVALESLVQELGVSLAQVTYVGNDINDQPCLSRVGLPIVVQDAHPAVLPLARYQTRTRGGQGAVREVCDLFEHVLGASRR
jgi:3-deoxy-D-manno-octulosonate 8-phosphate phosphatase (KDO 8-P phosphatase)